jgi:hypothetical protein
MSAGNIGAGPYNNFYDCESHSKHRGSLSHNFFGVNSLVDHDNLENQNSEKFIDTSYNNSHEAQVATYL